jgi:hypothetical protein
MTNRTHPMRRHSRFPVRWSMFYGNDQFLAEGTVLDVTRLGWRVAGTMAVVPGTHITLQVWVPDKVRPLYVQRATVLWVTGQEFAIEVQDMSPRDQAWMTDFLNHKLGFMWMSHPTVHERSPQNPPRLPLGETDPVPASESGGEDTLHRRLGISAYTIDVPANVRQRSAFPLQSDEEDPPSDRVLEDTWVTSLRLIRGMEALLDRRGRTGQDPIAGN